MKEKLRKISKYTSRLIILSFFLPFVTLCSVSKEKRVASPEQLQSIDSSATIDVKSDSVMFDINKEEIKNKSLSGSLISTLFPKDSATGFDIALLNIPKGLHLTTDDFLGLLFPFTLLLLFILAVRSFLKNHADFSNFLLILPAFLFYSYITFAVIGDDMLYGFWIAVSLILITFILNSVIYFYKKGEEV